MRNPTLLSACAAAWAALGCATVPPAPPPQRQALSVTGAGQALERVTSDPVHELRPAISPDGHMLLFDLFVRDLPGGKIEKAIVGVDPDVAAGRTIYTASDYLSSEAAWLPDGSGFVFTSNSAGAWALVRSVANVPHAAIAVLVSGEVAPLVSRPTVSPDGKRVAFGTQIRRIWTIATASIDGSHLTLLGEGMQPAWSPDGKWIAFTRTVAGKNHIFAVDPDTGTKLVQVTTGDYTDEYPAWSPDGASIVFASSRGAQSRATANPKTRNLFLVRTDGTGLTQLTDGDAESSAPCWSRNGWIYFSSDHSGDFDIWRLKASLQEAAQANPPAK